MGRASTKTRLATRDDEPERVAEENNNNVSPQAERRGTSLGEHGIAIHYSFVQLCAWWAIWSVYDTYLLKYTPVSEIVTLILCVPLYLAPSLAQAAWDRTQQVQQSIQHSLERI
jgi:hypothetical protein